MKPVKLVSERLVFEPLNIKHLSKSYVDWMNDKEVNKFLESGGDYTIEKLEKFLQYQDEKHILFWAIKVKHTNCHIGNFKIDPVDTDKNSGEYGILMGEKKEWGKGYAKEASNRIIDFCFQELDLSAITLGVIESNIKAIKLYKNIGFEIYEEKRNVGIYDGVMCNSLRMIKFNDK